MLREDNKLTSAHEDEVQLQGSLLSGHSGWHLVSREKRYDMELGTIRCYKVGNLAWEIYVNA